MSRLLSALNYEFQRLQLEATATRMIGAHRVRIYSRSATVTVPAYRSLLIVGGLSTSSDEPTKQNALTHLLSLAY